MRWDRLGMLLVLGTGCEDATNVTVTPTDTTGDSEPVQVDIDPSPGRSWLELQLDGNQCDQAPAAPQPRVQQGNFLEGPQTERVMIVNGFYLAWSPCNESNLPAMAQPYSLLISAQDASGGTTPLPSEDFTVRALAPCECDPQIVLFNVAAGNEAAVVDQSGLPPGLMPRSRQLASGLHRFELSAPFADVNRAEWELP